MLRHPQSAPRSKPAWKLQPTRIGAGLQPKNGKGGRGTPKRWWWLTVCQARNSRAALHAHFGDGVESATRPQNCSVDLGCPSRAVLLRRRRRAHALCFPDRVPFPARGDGDEREQSPRRGSSAGQRQDVLLPLRFQGPGPDSLVVGPPGRVTPESQSGTEAPHAQTSPAPTPCAWTPAGPGLSSRWAAGRRPPRPGGSSRCRRSASGRPRTPASPGRGEGGESRAYQWAGRERVGGNSGPACKGSPSTRLRKCWDLASRSVRSTRPPPCVSGGTPRGAWRTSFSQRSRLGAVYLRNEGRDEGPHPGDPAARPEAEGTGGGRIDLRGERSALRPMAVPR